MHTKRLITSFVAMPILAILISFSPQALFAAFIAIVCLVAGWEYFYIIYSGRTARMYAAVPVFTVLCGAAVVIAAGSSRHDLMILIVLFQVLGAAVFSLFSFSVKKNILGHLEKAFQFIVYIPLSLATIVLLRGGPGGDVWVYFLVFIIFSGDVGAFYVGTYFGRHSLAPEISPKKTIEGAAGGLAANLIVGLLFKALFLPSFPFGVTIVFIVLAGLAGQVGDLFESELKRVSDIKDSGVILPGHGGILDRIDALLFAAPIAYIFHIFYAV
ncbi:MAG: phosphatidate cytidylyltransferase [Deltaproteobacteria bacterium]|nr:phosphatidate cytidylyltransferase [Deltaproteobacteria bacterium]